MILGLALIFNEQIKSFVVDHMSQNRIENISKKDIEKNNKKDGEFDFKKVKSIGAGQIAKAAVTGDIPVIGKLAIPSLNMKLPIAKGLSDPVLSSGAGTMKPDQVMGEGNYALAGHYMTDRGILFSPLERSQLGKLVYITDLNKVYTYKITYKKVIDPYQTQIINDVAGKSIITLITCADGGMNRWAIQGELVSVDNANNKTLQVFN